MLRHAKSSWDDPGLNDADRPLAPRGRRDARRLAAYLQREPIRPRLVLCSTALRTRGTLAAILRTIEGDVQISVEDALYAAGLEQLLTRLRAVPETVPSVLLIGHNPGLHELVLNLATPDSDLGQLKVNLPTTALVTLEITAAGWQQLVEGEHQLASCFVPRDLRS